MGILLSSRFLKGTARAASLPGAGGGYGWRFDRDTSRQPHRDSGRDLHGPADRRSDHVGNGLMQPDDPDKRKAYSLPQIQRHRRRQSVQFQLVEIRSGTRGKNGQRCRKRAGIRSTSFPAPERRKPPVGICRGCCAGEIEGNSVRSERSPVATLFDGRLSTSHLTLPLDERNQAGRYVIKVSLNEKIAMLKTAVL